MILFQNIFFSRKFLAYNGCFMLFTKTKKGSGTRFWCIFSARFFHKDVSYLILYLWTKFQCHAFFTSQDIKQKVLLSSYLDNWWCRNCKIYLQSSSKAMANRKKKGRPKWVFSMEWKAFFIVFEGLSFDKKIKIWQK